MQDHKGFFDEMAERWDQTVFHDPKKLSRIFEYIQIAPGQRALDVGTGTGVLIPYIEDRVGNEGQILAIDLSEKMLEKASEKYPYSNVQYIAGDIMDFPLEGEGFDCIICYSVFPHFTDQEKTVLHLSQGLNKGGKLIICHSQSRDGINQLHRSAGENVAKDLLPPMSSIVRMMEESNLRVIHEIDSDEMFLILGKKQG